MEDSPKSRFSGSRISPGPDLGRPSVPRLSHHKHRRGRGLALLSNVLLGAAKKALAGGGGRGGRPQPCSGTRQLQGLFSDSPSLTQPTLSGTLRPREGKRLSKVTQQATDTPTPHHHTHIPFHRKSAGIRQVPSARSGGWSVHRRRGWKCAKR